MNRRILAAAAGALVLLLGTGPGSFDLDHVRAE